MAASRKRFRPEENEIIPPLEGLTISKRPRESHKRGRGQEEMQAVCKRPRPQCETVDEESTFGREVYTTIHGAKHGLYQSFYPNGQLREMATYVDGQEEGTVQLWYSSGRPYLLYTMRDGLREGPALRWYNSGMLASQEYFKGGLEEGRATYFYADGQVQWEILFAGGEVVRLQHFERGD